MTAPPSPRGGQVGSFALDLSPVDLAISLGYQEIPLAPRDSAVDSFKSRAMGVGPDAEEAANDLWLRITTREEHECVGPAINALLDVGLGGNRAAVERLKSGLMGVITHLVFTAREKYEAERRPDGQPTTAQLKAAESVTVIDFVKAVNFVERHGTAQEKMDLKEELVCSLLSLPNESITRAVVLLLEEGSTIDLTSLPSDLEELVGRASSWPSNKCARVSAENAARNLAGIARQASVANDIVRCNQAMLCLRAVANGYHNLQAAEELLVMARGGNGVLRELACKALASIDFVRIASHEVECDVPNYIQLYRVLKKGALLLKDIRFVEAMIAFARKHPDGVFVMKELVDVDLLAPFYESRERELLRSMAKQGLAQIGLELGGIKVMNNISFYHMLNDPGLIGLRLPDNGIISSWRALLGVKSAEVYKHTIAAALEPCIYWLGVCERKGTSR